MKDFTVFKALLLALVFGSAIAAIAHADEKCYTIGQSFALNKKHISDLKMKHLTGPQIAAAIELLKDEAPEVIVDDAYASWSDKNDGRGVIVFMYKGCFVDALPISPEDRLKLLAYKGTGA